MNVVLASNDAHIAYRIPLHRGMLTCEDSMHAQGRMAAAEECCCYALITDTAVHLRALET